MSNQKGSERFATKPTDAVAGILTGDEAIQAIDNAVGREPGERDDAQGLGLNPPKNDPGYFGEDPEGEYVGDAQEFKFDPQENVNQRDEDEEQMAQTKTEQVDLK